MSAKFILPLFSLFTLYAIWYYAEVNGLLSLARESIARNTLPGSDAPLRTTYTGLPQLDSLLTTLTTFFWPTTDGSHPALTLHTLGFAGTFGSAWILITLESWRRGNAWTLAAYPLIFGLSAQTLTFAFAAPLYCALQLSTSITSHAPTAVNVHIPRSVLYALPWVFAVSYVLPSTLMILPISETITTDLKQIFIALWQPFPAYISILLTVINAVLSPFISVDKTGRKDHHALRFVYAFAFAHTAITHLVTWTISLITVLAPAILDERFRGELHPSIVFGIPTPWTSPVVQVQSVAEGVHAFLRWDYLIGSVGMVVWAGALYAGAQRVVYGTVGWWRLIVQVVLLTLVAGPVGAAVGLVWERDELVETGMKRVSEKAR
ncbi:uncharacterized protein BO80DRAFT_423174 [Aspergillus ibericus CBS 121593]|uniref:AtmA protein n=1 Tax=Aspergillus ibericus CBS 121593 TaxID=1448316 RepID=A0A395H6I0_9EURO|nr:hypothetical protein BO80DRAFT_423174 [Aspergillus ibericus CBS 121593]RAL03226.1 hypothetical protein BO80DRAFT_423174 [Aspergillus ibericus CBS 121593]